MSARLQNFSRGGAMVLLAVLGVLLGLGLRQSGGRWGDALLGASYDTLHAVGSESLDAIPTLPVGIVYLDLHSYLAERQDPAQPWPRELHARLVERLAAAGARAVVFDIVFGGPGASPESDAALAQAIRRHGRVVLAGEAAMAGHATDPRAASARWVTESLPYSLLATQAMAWGFANHRVDDDLVVRRFFEGFGTKDRASLAWATASALGLLGVEASGDGEGEKGFQGRWLRYYGPPMTLPNVSYAQALRPEGVPDAWFRDRVIWVGARPMSGLFQQRQDEFRSPFHAWGHPDRFMPGVEVHATAFLNLVRGDGLRRWSPMGEIGFLSMVAVAFGVGLVALRPAWSAVAAMAGAGLVLAGARVAFAEGVWLPWLIASGVQIPVALFGAWLVHFRDWYRDRRRLEAERREAETRIREQAALIEKAHDAILVWDLDGRIRYANASASNLFGWTREELLGATVARLGWASEAWNTARVAVLASGEWRGELCQRDRKGRERRVESGWTLIRNETGEPSALLVIATDVTEKRQWEAESLRLQRREAVGALASGMAHDLNNALAPVLMGTQILARQAKDDETRRVLQLMETGTRRGADMVRQVLLFARGQAGDTKRVELAPLVREMEKLIRQTFPKSVSVAVYIADELWPVQGNSTEFHQVLLNLCVNARDAMPGGGTLNLVLDNAILDADAAAKIPGGREGEFVTLLVSDSGTGIPSEVLPRIFEPFFTTKPEGVGTGLGLSTTVRIVKAHGGFLNVSSQLGEGTTFEIFLPRLQDGRAAVDGAAGEAEVRGSGEWVLVADDDLAVLEMLRRGLSDHGYQVLTAGGGAEVASVFAAQHGRISVVVCDVGMPGLEGPTAAGQVRSLAPDIPWIFMSGGALDETVRTAAGQSPVSRILAKPVSLPQLLRCVSESVAASGSRTGGVTPTPERDGR